MKLKQLRQFLPCSKINSPKNNQQKIVFLLLAIAFFGGFVPLGAEQLDVQAARSGLEFIVSIDGIDYSELRGIIEAGMVSKVLLHVQVVAPALIGERLFTDFVLSKRVSQGFFSGQPEIQDFQESEDFPEQECGQLYVPPVDSAEAIDWKKRFSTFHFRLNRPFPAGAQVRVRASWQPIEPVAQFRFLLGFFPGMQYHSGWAVVSAKINQEAGE